MTTLTMTALATTARAIPRKALAIPPKQMTAIGISIAVHGLVLLGVSALQPTAAYLPEPETGILVTLVEAPPRAAPRPAPAPPEARRPEPSASRSKSTATEPARAPSHLAAAAAPGKGEGDAPQPWPLQTAPNSSPSAAPAAQPVAPVSRGVGPGPAEDPLADYKRLVWAQLAAHAPAAAVGSGVVTAVLGLDESGTLLFVRLARSSGQPAFDRACLKAIRAASPLPRPPAGVSRDQLVFEVPIRARAR